MSDRIAVMNNGRVVQIGEPREVYEQPMTEFVASFLGVSNIFEGNVVERTGTKALIDLGIGRIFVSAGTAKINDRVRLAIRPEKIQITSADKGKGLPARIRELVYRGVTTHVYADCGDQKIVIYLQNVSPDAIAWHVGDEIVCQLEENSAVILNN